MQWQPLCDSRNPQFLVKGTELAQVILPLSNSRWAIIETRAIEAGGFPGVTYRIRDAETVTDAEIRSGKRPKIVARFKAFDEAVAWVQQESIDT